MNDIVIEIPTKKTIAKCPYIERFNQTYRGHVLDANKFDSLEEVRQETYR